MTIPPSAPPVLAEEPAADDDVMYLLGLANDTGEIVCECCAVHTTAIANPARLEAIALRLSLLAQAQRGREDAERLVRARDAAIAHLKSGDTTGAFAALTMQRDIPEMFDRSTFDEGQR